MKELLILNNIRKKSTEPNKSIEKSKKFSQSRSTELIVPCVSYQNNVGNLHNENWAYRVPYAFRDALDISYSTLYHKKISYQAWTQGCLINFVVGDRLSSDKGYCCLQVQSSKPVSLNPNSGEWDEGFVTYTNFDKLGSAQKTVSQMSFLQLLITGS